MPFISNSVLCYFSIYILIGQYAQNYMDLDRITTLLDEHPVLNNVLSLVFPKSCFLSSRHLPPCPGLASGLAETSKPP